MIDVRWLISAKQILLFLTGFVNVQNYFCKSAKSFVCVQNPFVQKAPLRSTGTACLIPPPPRPFHRYYVRFTPPPLPQFYCMVLRVPPPPPLTPTPFFTGTVCVSLPQLLHSPFQRYCLYLTPPPVPTVLCMFHPPPPLPVPPALRASHLVYLPPPPQFYRYCVPPSPSPHSHPTPYIVSPPSPFNPPLPVPPVLRALLGLVHLHTPSTQFVRYFITHTHTPAQFVRYFITHT